MHIVVVPGNSALLLRVLAGSPAEFLRTLFSLAECGPVVLRMLGYRQELLSRPADWLSGSQ